MKSLPIIVGLLLVPFWRASTHAAQAADAPVSGAALAAEMGCASCHADLGLPGSLRERIPDLSSAGRRYQPAYLFEFLQTPVKVRQHLGRARMPDFHLTQKEALALVAFLEAQQEAPHSWPEVPVRLQQQSAQPRPVSRIDFEAELAGGLLCLNCHTWEGKGGHVGVELANVSYRLKPAWVRMFLVAPEMFGVPETVMPAQFYRLPEGGKPLQELTAEAGRKLQVVTDYLFDLAPEKRKTLEEKFNAAKKSYPEASAAWGEQLFLSQNCAACHRHRALQPRAASAAPPLSGEGLRVTPSWLQSYLKHPVPIRPFGFRPGDGSRMPDFRLTDEEAAELTSFLSAQKQGGQPRAGEFKPRKLSVFAKRKAKALLTDKLSCLGCHRLGERGGRIGPALDNVRNRLQPAYVYGVIRDPRGVAPHSIMPRLPLPDVTIQLLANFLLQQDEPARSETYLSSAEHPLLLSEPNPPGGPLHHAAKNYFHHCGPCHGPAGGGDGFNAAFLTVQPTAHAKADYMSTRPDDTLYDGIHSGGYILNKSHAMPPWGGSFEPRQIKELVAWIRTLCRCQGPAWSLDNAEGGTPQPGH